jgi:hypothetical protein
MSDFNQRGFVPIRNLDGGPTITKTYRVSAGDNIAYFIGDAVTLGGTGRLKPVRATANIPVGVIVGLERVSGGKPAPLTFNQPTRGPFLATAQEGFAKVVVGLEQTYAVAIDKSITEADIGGTAFVSAGAPNTASGLSGQRLQGAVSAATDGHFQILGLAPIELLNTQFQTTASSASPAIVEVKINRSIFNNNPV